MTDWLEEPDSETRIKDFTEFHCRVSISLLIAINAYVAPN